MKTTTFLGAEMGLKQFAKGFAAEKQMIAAAAEGRTRERRPPRRSSDRRRPPQKLYYPRAGAPSHGRCPRPPRRRRMGRRSLKRKAGRRPSAA